MTLPLLTAYLRDPVHITVAFTLPAMMAGLFDPLSSTSEHGDIAGAIPSLTGYVVASQPDIDISITLPSLAVATESTSGNVGHFDIDFIPLTMSLYGGGQVNIVFPSVTGNISTIQGSLIAIAANLPSLVGAIGSSIDSLGQIEIELPGITGSVHVFSEIIGHISGAIPVLDFYGHTMVGSVGSLSTELPIIFYESVLLGGGLVQIDVTLPCTILTASGSLEDASITYRTIVMNTKNFGVTEYGDIELKGMVDVFGKTIAINSNSLVQIGHTLDNTAQINSTLQTGTIDFSGPAFTKPKDIWLNLRSGKKIQLTIKDNEVPTNEATYDSENFVEDLKKTRVKVGRGYSAEFFDLTINNVDGDLIDLTNIHVHGERLRKKR